MHITISYWVVFGLLLIFNLHQCFLGLLLKSKLKVIGRGSLLTQLSYLFPRCLMLFMGGLTAIIMISPWIDGTNDLPVKSVSGCFLAWTILTAIASVILLIRSNEKLN